MHAILSFLTYDRLEKEVSITFSPRFLLSQAYSVLLQGTVGFILLDALFQGIIIPLNNSVTKPLAVPARFNENCRS